VPLPSSLDPNRKQVGRWIAFEDWAKQQFIASAVMHGDEIDINIVSSFGFKLWIQGP
jgi:hypothetical protein